MVPTAVTAVLLLLLPWQDGQSVEVEPLEQHGTTPEGCGRRCARHRHKCRTRHGPRSTIAGEATDRGRRGRHEHRAVRNETHTTHTVKVEVGGKGWTTSGESGGWSPALDDASDQVDRATASRNPARLHEARQDHGG